MPDFFAICVPIFASVLVGAIPTLTGMPTHLSTRSFILCPYTGLRRVPTLTFKISSFQELCNQFQKSVVLNATLQNQNELLMTYVVEASLDITLNDPIDTYFRTVDDVLDCRYSFAATCKANGICFRKWLEDVLPRLNSTPAGQIDSLILGEKQSCQ